MTSTEFDQIYLKTFNPQQIEAVHSVDGAVLLLAVPGSGKTTVLVTRLGYMIHCHGIPAQRILTMTYTVAATVEMRQRFVDLFGKDIADGTADPDHDLYRRRHRGDAPAICRSVRQRHR